MRRFAIRLIIVFAVLLVASQLLIPPLASRHVENQITAHGGHADAHLSAFPAFLLLFRHGKLRLNANQLSVDLGKNEDVFKQLDDFSDVDISVKDSRAGPFSISDFEVRRIAKQRYAVAIAGDGTAGDVARYAGSRLGGGFGQALAGLAASALGGFDRSIPFNAQMEIDTVSGGARATSVNGSIDGLPAGPLVEVTANALLSGI